MILKTIQIIPTGDANFYRVLINEQIAGIIQWTGAFSTAYQETLNDKISSALLGAI